MTAGSIGPAVFFGNCVKSFEKQRKGSILAVYYTPESEMTENHKKTILIVEDDVLVAMTEKNSLEKNGYNTLTVHTGEAAIHIFDTITAIDLVLMDIDLGRGIDGTQTAKTILEKNDLPIVFLSNHADPEIVEKTERISSYGYILKNTGPTILLASIRMAFRLFESNRLVEKTAAKLKTMLAAIPDLMFIVDRDGYFLDFQGPTGESHFALAPDKIIGGHLLNVFQQDEAERLLSLFKVCLSTGQVQNYAYSLNFGDETRFYDLRLTKIDMLTILAIVRDVTAAKKTEITLRESEELHSSILNASPDNITLTDLNGNMIMFSPAALKMFGHDSGEGLYGHPVTDFLVPEDRERAGANFMKLRQGFLLGAEQYKGIRRDGSILDVEINAEFVRDANGQPCKIVFIVRDITERRKKNDEIRALLAEKELILKEVHHRIKNNMSTINSLLSIQAGMVDEPAATVALEDACNRIQSMMLLYDKLYQSAEFNEMSVARYLPELVDEIIANFPGSGSVTVRKDIGDFVLGVKKLQPVGIILNELLTNIMKYAFPDKTDGIISVSAALEGSRFRLTVEDNGTGMPDSVDFKNPSGFGILLVGELTRQLKGTIRFEKTDGTRIVLEFDR